LARNLHSVYVTRETYPDSRCVLGGCTGYPLAGTGCRGRYLLFQIWQWLDDQDKSLLVIKMLSEREGILPAIEYIKDWGNPFLVINIGRNAPGHQYTCLKQPL
jgi:hypothetical protein